MNTGSGRTSAPVCNQSIRVLVLIKLQVDDRRVLLVVVVLWGEGTFAYKPVEILTQLSCPDLI